MLKRGVKRQLTHLEATRLATRGGPSMFDRPQQTHLGIRPRFRNGIP